MKNLLPCPFCGGEANTALVTRNSGLWFVTYCLKCHCEILDLKPVDSNDTKASEPDYTIKAWNTRKEN